MPVEQVPGFWDYLGQGIQKGVQMHTESEDKKRAQAQANAGLMAQLFQAGAIEAPQLQSALTEAGIDPTKATVQPNKAQKRREILAQGQPAVDALSDEQKTDLGFKTAAQKTIEASDVSTATIATKKNDILGRYMNGDKLTDVEREATGLHGADDIELKKLNQLDPYLGQVGERYVASQIIKSGGTIAKGTAKQVAEQAFTDYVTERGANGLGSLSPEQVQYTRSYFDRATQNALIAQSKEDLAKYQAESGRISANATATWRERQMTGGDQSVKWAGVMNKGEETVRKSMADLMKKPMMSMVDVLPAEAIQQMAAKNPAFAADLQNYQLLKQKSEAYRGAIAELANGAIPGTLPMLLKDAESMGTQGANYGAPAATQPPGTTRLGAPPLAGGAAPQGNGFNPQAAAQLIIDGKAGLETLRNYVSVGKITQQQFDQVSQLAAAGKKVANQKKYGGAQKVDSPIVRRP